MMRKTTAKKAESECENDLTEEYCDDFTPPPHRRFLADVIRQGNPDILREALDAFYGIAISFSEDATADHIDEPVEEAYTALHVAAMEGHLSCVKLLLEKGANLEADYTCITPLHLACCEKGSTEIADFLLKSAKSPECVKRMLDARNMVGNTPLHFAAEYNHVDTIRLFLEWGASLTMKNAYGKTPIHMAKPNSEARRILEEAARGKTEAKKTTQNQAVPVNELMEMDKDNINDLEDGGPKYYSDPENPTLPHLWKLAAVVQRGNVDALRYALDKLNGSIDAPVSKGRTALHLAIEGGHLSCVELLLARGANLEVHLKGATPLHYACGCTGNTEIARLLLQSAKDSECLKRMLEAGDMDGETPLHFAARYGHVDIIRLLLDAGASPIKKNRFNKQTPIDMAKLGSEARMILEAQLLPP